MILVNRVSDFEASIRTVSGKRISLYCGDGNVDQLIDWYLAPLSSEFRALSTYNRALLDSLEDTREIDLAALGGE